MPYFELDVEAFFEEGVNRVGILLLLLCQGTLVCVFALGVLSVTDLIILEDALDFSLHVS